MLPRCCFIGPPIGLMGFERQPYAQVAGRIGRGRGDGKGEYHAETRSRGEGLLLRVSASPRESAPPDRHPGESRYRMHISLLTRVPSAESMGLVIRHGGGDGSGSIRAGSVWRRPAGKRGALFHRALVAEAGPCIRRLAGSRAREMRFHRFLRHPRVRVSEMALTVGLRTAERASGRDVLVIQDTSEVAIGGRAARAAGFGPVGRGGATGGVLVHPAIVVDARDNALLGLLDVKVWNREGGKKQSKRGRALAEKESCRWLEGAETAARLPGKARSVTVVSDAERDIYELFPGRPFRHAPRRPRDPRSQLGRGRQAVAHVGR